MNLVVAVKAEPVRKARVTGPNRVTLLLTPSEEVADPDVLHRDASYLSKLEGTCFTCSKLNANPPQTVCETPDPEDPPQGCIVVSDPCTCADCPPPPPPKECACENGYPALITGLGSGYWVGLQANTFYSIVPSGGWVVAVSCETGVVVGAFPVTGTNYGYGRGIILGVPVMIYPSGAVRGAGYYPANDTSFPILALIPEEGNALIDTSFNIINDEPGCPIDNPDYFCAAENSYVYSGYPKPCLAKYPRQISGCTEFDEFYEWPIDLPYNIIPPSDPYYFDMKDVIGFEGQSLGTIKFETTTGQTYCGGIQDWIRQPTDALSGVCGAIPWVDTPIAFYNDCTECASAPCQFLLNLTNGPVNYTYGGYNSAGAIGQGGYYGIGPALPPQVQSGSIVNSSFWETFWNWTPTATADVTDFYILNDEIVFLPPLFDLLNICRCNDNSVRQSSIIFLEKFECCQTGVTNTPPIGLSIIKPFTPGYSGCNAPCWPTCVNPNCSCDAVHPDNLAKPAKHGYIPCRDCEITSTVPITGIWWSKDVVTVLGELAGNTIVTGSPTLPNPSERNICKNVLNSFKPQCSGPCFGMYELDNSGNYILVPERFRECTGFLDPYEFLQDACSRAYYFPAYLGQCELTYSETVPSGLDPSIFVNHIVFAEDCGECSAGTAVSECICTDPTDPDSCYLYNIGGPLSIGRELTGQCIVLGATFPCSVPRMEQKNYQVCSTGASIVAEGLSFIEVKNRLCFDENGIIYPDLHPDVVDQCSCCRETIIPDGLETGIPTANCSVLDTDECPICCHERGCATGNCLLPENVDYRPEICNL